MVYQIVIIIGRPVKRMNPWGPNPAFVNHVEMLVAAACHDDGHRLCRIVGPFKVSFIQFLSSFTIFLHVVGCTSLPYCVVLDGTTIPIIRDHSLVLDSASARDLVRVVATDMARGCVLP